MSNAVIMQSIGAPLSVTDATKARMSCRAFTPEPVPLQLVQELLSLASRAPSGANMQPWRVYVLAGPERQALVDAVAARMGEGAMPQDSPDFTVYPPREVLGLPRNHAMRDRRRKLGFDMYAKLGIARGDTAGMLEALKKNYEFFGAPVGIIVTVDKAFGMA